MNKKIGFIGQGFIGKNLADNFEARDIKVVRYAKEEEYAGNKDEIKTCDIVFVAVPTPTERSNFNGNILKGVIDITKEGAIVVIKSTIPPEFIRKLSKNFPDRIIVLSPEFLNEVTAKHDTDRPDRNIIGISNTDDEKLWKMAEELLDLLPVAKKNMICTYEEASLTKYAGNCFLYIKNMFFNMLHDLVVDYSGDWEIVREMVIADPRIGKAYTEIVHKNGRGAGGRCLPKDFVVFRKMYFEHIGKHDLDGCNILTYNEMKNKKLLTKSKKDLDILKEVYGED